MLKETETEETIVFFVTFLSLVAFQSEGEPPAPPPLSGYGYVALTSFTCMLYYNLITRFELIFCICLLCAEAQKRGHDTILHSKYASRCACLNSHSILVTV